MASKGQQFNLISSNAAYEIDRNPVGATLIYATGPLSVLHADDFNFLIQAQDKGGFGW